MMPTTPTTLQADETGAAIFTAIAFAFLAVALISAIVERKRWGWLPMILLMGGFVAALEESMIDRMILLWYPADSPGIVFTAFGHHQPLYMFVIYGGFVGTGTFYAMRSIRQDPSGRGLWAIFFSIVALDAFFEIIATATNTYYYYGDQPFQIVPDGWPLWVAAMAASSPVAAGVTLHLLESRVRGAPRLLFVLVPPVAWAAMYFVVGWPTYVTINSGSPAWLTWTAAVVTMGLAVGSVALLIRLVRATAHLPVAGPAVEPGLTGSPADPARDASLV